MATPDGDDPQSLSDAADPFETPGFARTYVITFVIRVAGAVAFVGGCGLAFITRPGGAVFVVSGAAALIVGSGVCSVSAYRVARSLGQDRYSSWVLSRPWSSPSLDRYRAYRALLRNEV
jgi:hypothetical protein